MSQTRNEDGTAAIELVFVAPILIVVFLLVVGLGRMAYARQQVEGVAADAARAASLERNTALSAAAGRDMARQSLGQAGLSCRALAVEVDISDYRPGGSVNVRVRCTASLADVALSGLPGQRVFSAQASVPIENWRSQ